MLFKLSDFPISWTVHYIHLKTAQIIISYNIWSLHNVQCWLLFPAPHCAVPIYHSPSVMLTITLNYTSCCIHSFTVLDIAHRTRLSFQQSPSNAFFLLRPFVVLWGGYRFLICGLKILHQLNFTRLTSERAPEHFLQVHMSLEPHQLIPLPWVFLLLY